MNRLTKYAAALLWLAGAPSVVAQDQFDQATALLKDGSLPEAYRAFLALAERGDAEAAYNIALLSKKGIGQPQNYRVSLFWAWTASLGGIEPGEMLAESLTGLMPESALSEVSLRLADALETRLDAGDRPAILQFARMQAEIAVPPDQTKAYIWYSVGAAIGLDGAHVAMRETASKLSPLELIDAQEQALEAFRNSVFSKVSAPES